MGRIIKVGFGLSALMAGAASCPHGLAQAVEAPPDCGSAGPDVDLDAVAIVIIGTDEQRGPHRHAGADFICVPRLGGRPDQVAGRRRTWSSATTRLSSATSEPPVVRRRSTPVPGDDQVLPVPGDDVVDGRRRWTTSWPWPSGTTLPRAAAGTTSSTADSDADDEIGGPGADLLAGGFDDDDGRRVVPATTCWWARSRPTPAAASGRRGAGAGPRTTGASGGGGASTRQGFRLRIRAGGGRRPHSDRTALAAGCAGVHARRGGAPA